ncbi:3-oxo-5-alpha-steroid 4-dehydrogenase-domain-containing protein [Mucor mucedo]|uniref:3-oxo-5-alpha-steroid 4-dehydrogenase-domain-containing protein n=1 Tax=Mucor mucedo TaxID=29922 RepID=UPI0022200DD6|nr:3-oxo-5-alpha-steroid 4-dehydrogenase-domain-containing protein [Mucor mucedo]KAI7890554.1 3-oxo-5-alpha-steroid 4-dehydrogenase-domain-containing protein [Mucor mucedo]
MYLITFISSCLLILSFLSICVKVLPELHASVLSYGKLNLHNDKKPTTMWATQLSKLIVPKHYFSHFYVIGLAFALLSAIELTYLQLCHQPLMLIRVLKYDNMEGTQRLDKHACIVGFIMMTLHLTRRVYESFWIEKPSKTATMHFSHYLIGLGFYGAMVFGTWLEGLSSLGKPQVETHLFSTMVAIILFVYASIHQHKCHVILASLRKDTDSGYTIPRGDWFEWLVTPHYFADILVYLSLCILYRFQGHILFCGLVWTITNLSVVASETKLWYQVHFPTEKYNLAFPNGRWNIIPGCY